MTRCIVEETPLEDPPSSLTRSRFLDRYGDIYESSPWIAEAVWTRAESGKLDTVEALHAAMRHVVDTSDAERQLELIRLHPDLAGKAALAGNLSTASRDEQATAGLARLTEAQFALFQSLNARYRDKFGFPFVIAVRGLTVAEVLRAFENRLENDRKAEFAAALEECHKIALLRLKALSAEQA